MFAAEKGCGQSAVVPAAHGEFLTTCYDNGSIGRMSADGKVLPAYTQDKDGNKFHGPNDFAPDNHGGIYFTASGTPPEARDGKVYYIAADGTISLQAGDLHNANGLAVSKDGKILYVVETSEYRLVKFKIGPDASLSNRQLFVNLDEAHQARGPHLPRRRQNRPRTVPSIRPERARPMPLAGVIFIVDADGKRCAN